MKRSTMYGLGAALLASTSLAGYSPSPLRESSVAERLGKSGPGRPNNGSRKKTKAARKQNHRRKS